MTEKLKPCPFCGSETAPTVIDLGVDLGTIGSVTIVVCHIPHKGCGAATNWRENSEKAIAKWNHRANEAAIDAAVKAAVLEEREACADVCANHVGGHKYVALRCRDAILARSDDDL